MVHKGDETLLSGCVYYEESLNGDPEQAADVKMAFVFHFILFTPLTVHVDN